MKFALKSKLKYRYLYLFKGFKNFLNNFNISIIISKSIWIDTSRFTSGYPGKFNIEIIEQDAFSNLNQLDYIELSDNLLNFIETKAFSNLKNLKFQIFSRNFPRI